MQEDILINNEATFYKYLEQDHAGNFGKNDFNKTAEYEEHVFAKFQRHFWNYLNSIIFGTDGYCAFKEQKDYLLNKIIKCSISCPYLLHLEAVVKLHLKRNGMILKTSRLSHHLCLKGNEVQSSPRCLSQTL